MSSRSIVNVGKYSKMLSHSVLGWVVVPVNGLPRGALSSGILKMENINEGQDVMHPNFSISEEIELLSLEFIRYLTRQDEKLVCLKNFPGHYFRGITTIFTC